MKIKDKISEIRKEAVQSIRNLMEKHQISILYTDELSTGNSPVVHEDTSDSHFTFVLDKIELREDGTLVFTSSNCWDDTTEDEDGLSTDTLADIADWINEYEYKIE